jgi:hypothetical protein
MCFGFMVVAIYINKWRQTWTQSTSIPKECYTNKNTQHSVYSANIKVSQYKSILWRITSKIYCVSNLLALDYRVIAFQGLLCVKPACARTIAGSHFKVLLCVKPASARLLRNRVSKQIANYSAKACRKHCNKEDYKKQAHRNQWFLPKIFSSYQRHGRPPEP